VGLEANDAFPMLAVAPEWGSFYKIIFEIRYRGGCVNQREARDNNAIRRSFSSGPISATPHAL
jgi:hypothetical protein